MPTAGRGGATTAGQVRLHHRKPWPFSTSLANLPPLQSLCATLHPPRGSPHPPLPPSAHVITGGLPGAWPPDHHRRSVPSAVACAAFPPARTAASQPSPRRPHRSHSTHTTQCRPGTAARRDDRLRSADQLHPSAAAAAAAEGRRRAEPQRGGAAGLPATPQPALICRFLLSPSQAETETGAESETAGHAEHHHLPSLPSDGLSRGRR